MTKLLLCTDLDRTLIPNGKQPESLAVRNKFNQLVAQDEVTLVYVSGRDESLVKQAMKNFHLPLPDFVIADVGSSIYQIINGKWIHLIKWDSEISDDWNGYNNSDLQKLLSEYKDIIKQDYKKQKSHKLSYFVPLYIDHLDLLDRIKFCFENEHVKANLIWSVDEEKAIGLLDILPVSANKKHAIEFVMKEFDFSLTETIFAGDSGNDISVMASPIQSILVANATDSVKSQALSQAKLNGQDKSIYIAQGDFLGMNGNYGAGILEGIVHYMPAASQWIGEKHE